MNRSSSFILTRCIALLLVTFVQWPSSARADQILEIHSDSLTTYRAVS